MSELKPVIKQAKKNNKKKAVKPPMPKKKAGKVRQNKPKSNVKNAYVLYTPNSVSGDNNYAVQIQTVADPRSLKTMLFNLGSYILKCGLGENGERSKDVNAQTLWSGLDYMLAGIWEEAKGGEVKLSTRPKVIHDIIMALKNKTITTRGGAFAYSWADTVTMEPIATTTYGFPQYFTVIPNVSPVNYLDTSFVAYTGVPQAAEYSKLLKYLDTMNNPYLKTVGCDSPSTLTNDVCTRARVYTYCGLRPTKASGWAVSVENEVPIWRSVLSKFVPYDDSTPEDRRIPNHLLISSGDPCSMLGMLYKGMFGPCPSAYNNRLAPVFVQVDFESIYNVLCQWMVLAKQAAFSSGLSNDFTIATASLPFTAQDFRIALMQALKFVFDSEDTQFVGSLEYNDQGNEFIPFVCGGNCYANSNFARSLLVPALIQENIASLRARYIGVDGGRHTCAYVPILGRYYQDTPAEWQMNFGQEGPVPLFSQTVQQAINILDCSTGSVPVDANNGFYAGVISDWNVVVNALNTFTSETVPLQGDRGPTGLPLVCFTNSERVTPLTNNVSGPRKPSLLIDRNISNFNPVKQEAAKGQKVQYVPAATLPQLDLQTAYTLLPSSESELITLVQNLIVPSIRFNEAEPGDILNSNMFQVRTKFKNSQSIGTAQNLDTQTKAAFIARLAGFCIVGVGKEKTSVYDDLMSTLRDEGKASGLFSLLAKAVGTFIPAAAPIADMIAGALDK